jgi:hypothetical protein
MIAEEGAAYAMWRPGQEGNRFERWYGEWRGQASGIRNQGSGSSGIRDQDDISAS